MKRLAILLLTAILLLALLPGTALAENKFYFNSAYNTVFEGETLQLELIREGDCADEGTLTFTTSNKKAVTVDSDGMIYGVGKGTATITATLKGAKRTWTAKLTVTCARAVNEVRVSESSLPLYDAYEPVLADVLEPWYEDDLPVMVIRKGKSLTISATLYPTDATNRKWQMTSSDPDIARVSGTSLTARSVGECVLTVESIQNPEIYVRYRVLVLEPVTKVKVTGTEKVIYVGESLVLDATVSPANATLQGVEWSSSREDNASVDEYGVVTGVSKGDAVIKAKAIDGSGQYATYTVTVKQQPEEITLSKDSITLKAGNYVTMKATVLPDTTNDKSVVWYSSDESVAKVNSSGRVTAVSPGMAIITCESKTHSYVYAQMVVNVYQPVTSISFNEKNPYVAVGESINLTWEVGPLNATDSSVTLSTNKESVLEVHQDGTIYGLKRGEAYVYATANDGSGKKASIKVTVTQPVEGVEVKYTEMSVGVGEKVSNTATMIPSDATITSMTWYSLDPNIATVSGTGTKATVTGKAWGDTTIIGVTEDGSYVTTFDISVGNLDEALVITNLYVENSDTIRIVTYNQSNLVITRFYYEIELYDAWGNPLICNSRNYTNMFEGSNKHTIYPGESLGKGTYSFGSEFSRPWGIGKVVMTITGYETEDGTSRYIRQENRVYKVWQATVVEY
nr:Ig-like domain-containing protein [Clostridia bacterium]